MVDHVILVQKLLKLHLPGFVVNWIGVFLTGRSQQCKVNGCLSRAVNIGLSIVQRPHAVCRLPMTRRMAIAN